MKRPTVLFSLFSYFIFIASCPSFPSVDNSPGHSKYPTQFIHTTSEVFNPDFIRYIITKILFSPAASASRVVETKPIFKKRFVFFRKLLL